MVILFFLRNFHSSFIVTISIPASILATFVMMYFKGELFSPMSLNMMSLGGLALAVGMLVDNAIVVIENIFRFREMGYDGKEAAVKGTNEVSSAIFSSTLTTVAVFFPLIFVPGLAGQIFKDLAFTVCFGLIASLGVAMTLIPLLATSVRMKKTTEKVSIDEIKKSIYFLKKGVKIKSLFLIIILSVLGVFLFSLFALSKLDQELLPKVDQGQFMVKVDLPTGSILKNTNKVISQIEKYVLGLPETDSAAVSIGSDKQSKSNQTDINLLGSHQGEILVTLKEDRAIPTSEVVQNIKSSVTHMDLGNVSIQYVLQESIFKSLTGTSSPIVVQLSGYELDILNGLADRVQANLTKIKGMYSIKSSKALASPETRIEILKDNAAKYAVSVDEIAAIAHTALKGIVATMYKEEGREYDIRVQLREQDRKDFMGIRELLIYSDSTNVYLPLKQVARISRGSGPSEIKRVDQERTLLVTGNIFGRELKSVTADVERMIRSITKDIPEGYVVELAGENKEINESFNSLMMALILSILLIYMIMASQFESFIQPFIIMLTVPLSLIGVYFALSLTNTPISVVVILGIIMLGGIVVNNGIVLIEFINSLRAKGYSPLDASFIASKIRQRPILMSALTTIIGLIPLALGFEKGSELRAPMAITVMGGLTTSTFLTLFMIPIIYYYIESGKLFLEKLFKKILRRNGTTI